MVNVKVRRMLALMLVIEAIINQASVAKAADADFAVIDISSESEENLALETEEIEEEAVDGAESDDEKKRDLSEHDVLSEFEELTEGVDYERDEVICLADSLEEAEYAAKAYGGELTDYRYGVATISLSSSDLSVAEAFEQALDPDKDMPVIEPNYLVSIEEPGDARKGDINTFDSSEEIPTESDWYDQYYVNGYDDPALLITANNYQYQHEIIGSYGAWGVTTGSQDIIVAIIDSGVDYTHEEFEGRIIDVSEDIDERDNNNMDEVHHGTHVAGIVAAAIGNDKGGAGVAPGVSIMPISVYNGSGSASTASMVRAIQYVAGANYESKHGSSVTGFSGRRADVINISIGSKYYSAAMKSAVNNAYKAGVTIVASMGNDGSGVASYPAFYDHVIGVCATTRTNALYYSSNYGEWADISAPGHTIYSTYWVNGSKNAYGTLSGTSMAAPVVTGACALYMSAVGHVDPDTMERVLKENAIPADEHMGAGIVNLIGMLNGDVTGPKISIYSSAEENENGVLLAASENGKTVTAAYDVAQDSRIDFTPLNYGGTGAGNTNTAIVYTVDGQNPVVANGVITHGIKWDGNPISVDELGFSFEGRSTVTVKALAVTGMGVAGKVTTLKFTVDADMEDYAVDQDLDTGVKVTIVGAPKTMVAGKTITLSAVVTPSTQSQKVIWKIDSYKNGDLSGASITATGKLTTRADQSGTLYVTCTTADNRVTAEPVAISISKEVNPVKAIAVEKTKQLDFNSYTGLGDSANIFIASLIDIKGNNLLENGGYKNVSLEWTSSNTEVAAVTGTDLDGSPCGVVTAKKPGTAKITVRALDGSGKSAYCTVTVASEKLVSSIKICKDAFVNDVLSSEVVKSAVLYLDPDGDLSDTIEVFAEQYDKNSKYLSAVAAPSWSSSNPGVAKVVGVSGDDNRITILAVSKGKAKITCTARDGSNKTASISIEVKQAVNEIRISGQEYIAQGSSATFKAAVYPASANNKAVTWSALDENDKAISGVSITSGGKLSVSSSVANGTRIYIKAVAKDGSRLREYSYVTVKPKAAEVRLVSENVPATLYLDRTSKTAETYHETYELSAKADDGSRLVWSSSNTKILSVSNAFYDSSTGINSVTVNAKDKGRAFVTAKADDGSGKSVKVSFKVERLLKDVIISGQNYVPRGTVALYKAAVSGDLANNKKVNWSMADGGGSGVTVDARTGKVTVASYAPIKEYTVVATAADGGGATCSYSFTVTSGKTSKVSIDVDTQSDNYSENPIYKLVWKNNALSSMQLSDVDFFSSYGRDDERDLRLLVYIEGNNGIKGVWNSSNSDIAVVSQDGVVTGKSKGTATITCMANDGSGKKASVKVSVITPTSGLELSTRNSISTDVCYGKSVVINPKLGTAYGALSENKVEWDYEIVGFTYDIAQTLKKNKAFFTFSNGKVTVNTKQNWDKNLEKYRGYRTSESGEVYLNVYATTIDGTNIEKSIRIFAIDPMEEILIGKMNENGDFVEYKEHDFTYSSTTQNNARIDKFAIVCDEARSYEVTSNNPAVASGLYKSSDANEKLWIYVNGIGKATITVKVKDGSELSRSITINVLEPKE